MKWHQEISDYLLQENYQVVSEFYEELIEAEPKVILHYWLLGLAYLLEAREAEAESTWLSILTEVEDTAEFSEILDTEATRQKQIHNLEKSWLIRKYLQEIEPDKINNLLSLLELELALNIFVFERLEEWNVLDKLKSSSRGDVNISLLVFIIEQLIEKGVPEISGILQASLPFLKEEPNFLDIALSINLKIAVQYNNPQLAIEISKTALEKQPNNLYLLNNISEYYWLAGDYQNAVKSIKQLKEKSNTKLLQVYADYRLIDFFLKTGDWLNVQDKVQDYLQDLKSLIDGDLNITKTLVQETFILMANKLPYIKDNPRETRYFQNKISAIFQKHLQGWLQFPKVTISPQRKQRKFPKIGYISSTLGRNSVGWLSRWLFKYHNKEQFPIYLYLISQSEDDITISWFRQNAAKCYNLPMEPLMIAHQIFSDEIDILIDLDSLTKPVNCAVMALKPAPIQITWLGMDATGIPNVDYFIVDPYVVPENAQEYYQEKLWRLPQTYLAVSGFEVAVPTLTREDLKIPKEAIIYLTAQVGTKRHPEMISLQLKILKAVPESYLLIKGLADIKAVKELFFKLAEAEGISTERLRFLPPSPNEEIHRANLSIADIVLDTYPYNGATTTLEVLWMGIPLVTLVGEQFAARNSYTFMLNAGITEGIAFNQLSYLEWGIRLGLEEELRASIHWKLLKNRQTSPLWNAQQFTQEMEKAYQQMWNNL